MRLIDADALKKEYIETDKWGADEMRVSTATVSTKLKEAGMNITAVVDA